MSFASKLQKAGASALKSVNSMTSKFSKPALPLSKQAGATPFKSHPKEKQAEKEKENKDPVKDAMESDDEDADFQPEKTDVEVSESESEHEPEPQPEPEPAPKEKKKKKKSTRKGAAKTQPPKAGVTPVRHRRGGVTSDERLFVGKVYKNAPIRRMFIRSMGDVQVTPLANLGASFFLHTFIRNVTNFAAVLADSRKSKTLMISDIVKGYKMAGTHKIESGVYV